MCWRRREPISRRLLQILTERIEFLTQGGPAPQIDPRFPALDSGLLGPVVTPGNLTMTVARRRLAVRRSLRTWRAPSRASSSGCRSFPTTRWRPSPATATCLIQICSDTPDTNIHALRDIIKNFPDLAGAALEDGRLSMRRRAANQPAPTPRNLLGFKDGTANPDASTTMRRWTASSGSRADSRRAGLGGGRQLPGGAHHPQFRRALGSNAAAGAADDHRPRQDDRRAAWRWPPSGIFPTMRATRRASASGSTRISGSPIRATPQSQANLILRRPYNYSRGVTKAGQLDMGLLFICFQADLQDGFVAVQNRLNGEPLEEYIKPVGGGFFFALPGVPAKGSYLGQSLIEATEPPGDRRPFHPKKVKLRKSK